MSGAQKRILLVDDEPAILKTVGKRLQVAGFQVAVATDGPAGLQKAQDDPPDLIILDVMLPALNGFDVCTRLKQDPRTKHIPVILFTAKDQEEDYWKGKACGADAYLTKPFKAEDLQQLASRLVDALRREPPTREAGDAAV